MAEAKEEIASRCARNFTTDFYKNVAGETEDNFVSSALSAHVVLAMAAYGAEGETGKQMRQALHLPENDAEVYLSFQSFISNLNSIEKVILKLANKIYVSKNISIKDKFKEITSTYFYSETITLDFSNGEKSAKLVNQWCHDKTNGNIQNIISKDDLYDGTALILLNAVYLKGNWKHKFKIKRTKLKPFHIDKSTTVNVLTMHIKKKFFYKNLKELNAECVALPYENEDLSLVLIVPKEVKPSGLKEIEENLEKVDFKHEHLQRSKRVVKLALPKFKTETIIELNSHLMKMGMVEMFSNKANFNSISDSSIKVDKVLQKAFIEINEEGCEAAAVYTMRSEACCLPPPPVKLNVDRPFYYKIVYKNVTLFSGSHRKSSH